VLQAEDGLRLAAGDTLVLSGLPEPLALAEEKLLRSGESRPEPAARIAGRSASAQITGACRVTMARKRDRHHGAGRAQQLESERRRALRQLLHARAAQGPDHARRHGLDVGGARRVAEQARLADDGAGTQDRDLVAARRLRR
jgi:hypothetical protein